MYNDDVYDKSKEVKMSDSGIIEDCQWGLGYDKPGWDVKNKNSVALQI